MALQPHSNWEATGWTTGQSTAIRLGFDSRSLLAAPRQHTHPPDFIGTGEDSRFAGRNLHMSLARLNTLIQKHGGTWAYLMDKSKDQPRAFY